MDLLSGYETTAVLADQGYAVNEFINWMEQANTEVVIAAKRSRLVERLIDENLYKDRNKVKRYFSKLKQYSWVATRYENTALSFAGFIYLASALILLA